MRRILPFAVALALVLVLFGVNTIAYENTYDPWVPTVPNKTQISVLVEENDTYYMPDMAPMVFSGVHVNGRTIFGYELEVGTDYNLYSRDGNTVIKLAKPLDLESGEYVMIFEFITGYAIVNYIV